MGGLRRTVVVALLCMVAPGVFAQEDAVRIAEARVALDSYKDCAGAQRALDGVTERGRQSPHWVFHMARATECLREYARAFSLYETYNKMVPGQQVIIDKMGEMSYLMKRSSGEASVIPQVQASAAPEPMRREPAKPDVLAAVQGAWVGSFDGDPAAQFRIDAGNATLQLTKDGGKGRELFRCEPGSDAAQIVCRAHAFEHDSILTRLRWSLDVFTLRLQDGSGDKRLEGTYRDAGGRQGPLRFERQ